jgi:ABC-type lipoprotein export system ATPase subunit
MSVLLQIEDLSKTYAGTAGTVTAVDGISLTVGAGEFAAVQGPSGCGKTTLLLAAGGLLRPTAGKVLLNGQELYALSSGQRAQSRAMHIGFVFQQFHLVPYFSALENILTPTLALPAACSSRRESGLISSPHPDGADSRPLPQNAERKGAARSRALELAAQLGLSDRLRHVPAALSTGERQRVALARALLNQPKLLLADEPTGNLDAANGQTVLRCLADFARRGGSVLLVTHEPDVSNFATRILRMEGGRIR